MDTEMDEDFVPPTEKNLTVLCERNGKVKHVAPGEFVQPLGSTELIGAVGAMYETMNTVQAIWLKSKVPFETNEVFQALRIATRQVPQLYFCLARSGISLWFKRMEEFVLDFQVSTDDIIDVYKEMLDTKFDIWNGPLWKVRMVIPNANVECGGSEGGYSFALLVCIQHTITDGFTNMKICRDVVSFLNQMKAGKTITSETIPIYPVKDDLLMTPQPYSYYLKYALKKLLKCSSRYLSQDTTFEGRLPLPITYDKKTQVLFDGLTCQETRDLTRICKCNEITINTCIVTAANFALLEVAQSKSISPLGPQVIYTIHTVNTRRYYSPEYRDATGCHISFIEDECQMSLSDAGNFWDQARKIQRNMKNHLETEKNHLKILPLVRTMAMTFPLNNYLTNTGRTCRNDCHYAVTNMGNLKDLLPGPKEGDCIEITNVLRSSSGNTFGYPILLTFHTFREKLLLSADYSPNKMENEIAQLFFKTLCAFIRNLANQESFYDLQKS